MGRKCSEIRDRQVLSCGTVGEDYLPQVGNITHHLKSFFRPPVNNHTMTLLQAS